MTQVIVQLDVTSIGSMNEPLLRESFAVVEQGWENDVAYGDYRQVIILCDGDVLERQSQ